MENQILVFVSQSKYGFQNPHMGFKTHIYVLKLDFLFLKKTRKVLPMQNPYVGFEKQIWILKPIFTV